MLIRCRTSKGDCDLLRSKKNFRAIFEIKIGSNIRSLVDEAYQQGKLVLLFCLCGWSSDCKG